MGVCESMSALSSFQKHAPKKKGKKKKKRETANVIVNFACAEITTTTTTTTTTNPKKQTKQNKTKLQPHIISTLVTFAGKSNGLQKNHKTYVLHKTCP